MRCPICDQKAPNCDCTATERAQHSLLEDAIYEIDLRRAEIARLTAERDAAILERRAAQEEVEDWSRRCARILDERDAARARVAELEAAPPPRGWLTAEERAAVEEAMVDYASNVGDNECERIERVLRALLARETPPRVKAPSKAFIILDNAWIAAIRDAGGEVE